jgi:hypothetical protein
MDDIYARYALGAERLLSSLDTKDERYLDVCAFQHSLDMSIDKLRVYGDNDPHGMATLLRTLRQLDQICLEIYKMNFKSWCEQIIIEEREEKNSERDPLYPYIGDWQALQEGKLQHFLHRELAEQGIHIPTKRPIPVEDSIERYRTIPLHAMVLYTSQDPTVFPYIRKHWDALESQFRDICDVYFSVDQLAGGEDGNDIITSSYILKKFGFRSSTLLPGIFFWDQHENSEFVSFGRDAHEKEITYICRSLFEELIDDPSIAAIRRAKVIIDRSRHKLQEWNSSKPS